MITRGLTYAKRRRKYYTFSFKIAYVERGGKKEKRRERKVIYILFQNNPNLDFVTLLDGFSTVNHCHEHSKIFCRVNGKNYPSRATLFIFHVINISVQSCLIMKKNSLVYIRSSKNQPSTT